MGDWIDGSVIKSLPYRTPIHTGHHSILPHDSHKAHDDSLTYMPL